jgi:hypothetical protein
VSNYVELPLATLRRHGDETSVEIYNALRLIEERLNTLSKAKVVPTNNQSRDYRINTNDLFL